MQQVILKFVSSARAAGLRIATSETLDCLNQLRLVDPLNERQFSRVLRANFAKSRRDQATFDRLYHLFFHELRVDEALGGAEPIAPYTQTILGRLKEKAETENILPVVVDFVAGDPVGYIAALRGIESHAAATAGGVGTGMDAMVRRLHMLLSLNRIRGSAAEFLSRNRERIPWETREAIADHLYQRTESALRLMKKGIVPGQPPPAKKKRSQKDRGARLEETPFASLTRKEVVEMRDAVGELVRKLKDILGRRRVKNRRGAPDVKKTLRNACRFQGIPMQITCRKQAPRKGKLAVLCDVSGSVWSSARFMLNMLYALQERFTRVRSFIFVAGVDEVTSFFDDHDIDSAIEKVMKNADIEYGASTDYGRTFREFSAMYMDALDKKTTLIIIGDGRTNYTHPEPGILDQMRERCRRIIWLNPEDQRFWYSGDSEMRTYEPFCHEVRVCENLGQLTAFIRTLMLR